MKHGRLQIVFYIIFVCLVSNDGLRAGDWPIYKGNIYFTGNNDEITVKNNNLKWLFQADESVYNPIVSDGRVYFTDLKKTVYCLDEDSGKLLWKMSLKTYEKEFNSSAKAMGKVKYPLIRGKRLLLTDSLAIYCLDKVTGAVLWARTGMQNELKLEEMRNWDTSKSNRWQPGNNDQWDPAMTSRAIVDSIYSNPVINEDMIYYGTRNVFVSRDILNGHLRWNNTLIKSYSGFPSFYDNYIFTQSIDYSTNTFKLYCMDAGTGKIIWEKKITSPHIIFSPVVYQGNVYMASGEKLYCLALNTGEMVWERSFGDFITSNPSFTERAILFTVGNRSVVMIDPANGRELKNVDLGSKSSPNFVTIRDQIYLASTFNKLISGREVSFTSLKAVNMNTGDVLWEYMSSFPGGGGQPVASQGIMFLPAGNYIYAVGTDYYPRVIRGGSTVYDPYQKIDDDKDTAPPEMIDRKDTGDRKKEKPAEPEQMKMKKVTVSVNDGGAVNVPAEIEVIKWDQGKVIYSKKEKIDKPQQEIEIPDLNDVEITASADGFVPKKVIVPKEDRNVIIELDRLEKGKGIVVENIYFEVNEAYLKKESLNVLDSMIEAMKRNEKIKIEVRGHTDSTGTKEHNQKLSERRADAVVEYMIKNGISPERLKSVGMGLSKPIADNTTADGRRKNRRTEFFILDK